MLSSVRKKYHGHTFGAEVDTRVSEKVQSRGRTQLDPVQESAIGGIFEEELQEQDVEN